MPLWRCKVCGLIFEGPEPPEKCPKCGAPKEQFVRLTEQEEGLVLRSRVTNSLHTKALTLLQELAEVADKGIKDGLDPNCVKIFKEEKEFALITIQKVKAELEGHMKKGKWG